MEFVVHIGQVILDRFIAQAHGSGNFLIGLSIRHQLQHALFLRRERVRFCRGLYTVPGSEDGQRLCGDLWVKEGLPGTDGPKGFNENGGSGVFQDIALSA